MWCIAMILLYHINNPYASGFEISTWHFENLDGVTDFAMYVQHMPYGVACSYPSKYLWAI